MDQRRQCVGIVDVGADVGIENDGRRGLSQGGTGKSQDAQKPDWNCSAHASPE